MVYFLLYFPVFLGVFQESYTSGTCRTSSMSSSSNLIASDLNVRYLTHFKCLFCVRCKVETNRKLKECFLTFRRREYSEIQKWNAIHKAQVSRCNKIGFWGILLYQSACLLIPSFRISQSCETWQAADSDSAVEACTTFVRGSDEIPYSFLSLAIANTRSLQALEEKTS